MDFSQTFFQLQMTLMRALEMFDPSIFSIQFFHQMNKQSIATVISTAISLIIKVELTAKNLTNR